MNVLALILLKFCGKTKRRFLWDEEELTSLEKKLYFIHDKNLIQKWFNHDLILIKYFTAYSTITRTKTSIRYPREKDREKRKRDRKIIIVI